MRPLLSIFFLVLLQGCATLIEGTTQTVSVDTSPPGASCTIERDGHRIGAVAYTPGSLALSKSKEDLLITCGKEGYQPASLTQPPHFVATTFGNLIAGGLIGVVVDVTSGANFAYPKVVSLGLSPAGLVPPPMASAPLPITPSVPVAFRPPAPVLRPAPYYPMDADPNVAPVRLTGGVIEP